MFVRQLQRTLLVATALTALVGSSALHGRGVSAQDATPVVSSAGMSTVTVSGNPASSWTRDSGSRDRS